MQSDLQMQEFVIDLLKNKLPDYYYYHDFEHTLYVLTKSIEIATAEKCTEYEIRLIKTAALWHDTGFLNKYAGHEEESCLLVKKNLPEFGFDLVEIELICGMIMATKIPQMPTTKLEMIVADADLAYLGTTNPEKVADKLYKELKHLYPDLTDNGWNTIQISFMQNHHYFTKYCIENKEPLKQEYFQRLIK